MKHYIAPILAGAAALAGAVVGAVLYIVRRTRGR